MTIGQKIYALRKKALITQEQFADSLGVSRQAVSKWESDAAYPETDKIVKMAELFGVSCDYLLKESVDPADGALANRRRTLLTMFISFSAVSAAVGYVVALICYYSINETWAKFVGLGVLTAFLLAGFVLWQVGRYRFLNACDYSDEDKTHLAKMTKLYYCASLIAFFGYIPELVFYNLTVYGYIFLTMAYAAAGCAASAILSLFHTRAVQNKISALHICNTLIFAATALLAAAAIAYMMNIHSLADLHLIEISETSFAGRVAIIFGIVLLFLLASAILHRRFAHTPSPLFLSRLGTFIFCFLTLLFSLTEFTAVTCVAAALYVASFIAEAVFCRRCSRKDAVHALPLRIEVPVYVAVSAQIILIAAGGINFQVAEVFLALLAAAAAILYFIPSRADKCE